MNDNQFLQGLYEASAGIPDENGIPKMDEQKLRREMKYSKIGMRNEDIFKNEPKFHTCSMYHPCPICKKCMNKSGALYVACQNCAIPTCKHTDIDKQNMIKRNNFVHYVSKETMDTIKQLDKEVTGGKDE